jgi:ribosome-associated protein
MRELTLICDYMLLASGDSSPQIKAIVDHVQDRLDAAGFRLLRSEGYKAGRWVLLDYGDLVVHVFHPHERSFYALERLWGDAPILQLDGEAILAHNA